MHARMKSSDVQPSHDLRESLPKRRGVAVTHWLAIPLLFLAILLPMARADEKPQRVLKAGIIGLDTSHVTAFTKLLNNPKNEGDLAGVRVVAGFPGGSPDIPESKDRVAKFTSELRDK